MGFLTDFFAGRQDPQEAEMIRLLGGDPDGMRRDARRNGMLSLGAMLLGGGQGNGVRRTGQALAQFGQGGRGMAPEMDRLMQSFELKQRIKDMQAGESRKKYLLNFVNDEKNFEGVPENVRGIVQMAAQQGDMTLLDSFVKESLKHRKPEGFAPGDVFARRVAETMGYNTSDDQNIPADRRPEIFKMAQALRLQSDKSKGTSVTVNAAGEKKLFDVDAEEFAKQIADLQDSAMKTTTYAQNVAGFDSLLGDDPAMLPGELATREFVAAIPGVGGTIDKQKLARQTAANSVAQKLGVEELANLSGPDTDRDYTRVMKIGPRLNMTPEGRKLFAKITAAKAEQRNRIASYANTLLGRVRNGELRLEQAREELRKENERTQITPLFEDALRQFEQGDGAPKGAASPQGWSIQKIGAS